MERLTSNNKVLCNSIKEFANKNNISSLVLSARTGIPLEEVKKIKKGETIKLSSKYFEQIKGFMNAGNDIFGKKPTDKISLFHYILYIRNMDSREFEISTGIKIKDMELMIKERRLYSHKSDICKMLTEKEYSEIAAAPVVLPKKKDYQVIKSITRSSLLDLFLDKSKKSITQVAKETGLTTKVIQSIFEGIPCNDGFLEKVAKSVGTNLVTINSDPYNLMGENNMVGYFIVSEIKNVASNVYNYAQLVGISYNILKNIIAGTTCITHKDIDKIFSKINKYDLEELYEKLARPEPIKAITEVDILKAAVERNNNLAKSARELNTSTYVLNAVINGKKEISEIDHNKLIKFCGSDIDKFDNPRELTLSGFINIAAKKKGGISHVCKELNISKGGLTAALSKDYMYIPEKYTCILKYLDIKEEDILPLIKEDKRYIIKNYYHSNNISNINTTVLIRPPLHLRRNLIIVVENLLRLKRNFHTTEMV